MSAAAVFADNGVYVFFLSFSRRACAQPSTRFLFIIIISSSNKRLLYTRSHTSHHHHRRLTHARARAEGIYALVLAARVLDKNAHGSVNSVAVPSHGRFAGFPATRFRDRYEITSPPDFGDVPVGGDVLSAAYRFYNRRVRFFYRPPPPSVVGVSRVTAYPVANFYRDTPPTSHAAAGCCCCPPSRPDNV